MEKTMIWRGELAHPGRTPRTIERLSDGSYLLTVSGFDDVSEVVGAALGECLDVAFVQPGPLTAPRWWEAEVETLELLDESERESLRAEVHRRTERRTDLRQRAASVRTALDLYRAIEPVVLHTPLARLLAACTADELAVHDAGALVAVACWCNYGQSSEDARADEPTRSAIFDIAELCPSIAPTDLPSDGLATWPGPDQSRRGAALAQLLGLDVPDWLLA